jgi:hypothetical protein
VLPTKPPASQPSGQRAADKTDGMEVVVRRVRTKEGLLLKSVRLSALADSPSAFGSSYAAEADQPDEHWTDRATLGAAGERSVTFFAMVGESVVGLVSAYRQILQGSRPSWFQCGCRRHIDVQESPSNW